MATANIGSTAQLDKSVATNEAESHVVPISDVLRIPDLHRTMGSLSALEKCQLGILISATQPRVIVETGVWQGATTRFLSEFLRINGIAGTVYGFDLPEVIDSLLADDEFFQSASNVKLMKGSLPRSLSDWLSTEKESIDLALIDANHSFHAVYSELSLIGPHLSAGGYIFCHDYGNPGTAFERVMCAVNEFARRYGFVVLPFHSRFDSSADVKCEAAILHRRVRCSMSKRLYGWRKYYAESFPRVAHIWGSLRNMTGL